MTRVQLQDPHGNSSSKDSDTFFWSPWSLDMHMVYGLTCRQKTHVHKIKTNHHKIKKRKKISGQGYGMVDICYAQDSCANFKNHLTTELLLTTLTHINFIYQCTQTWSIAHSFNVYINLLGQHSKILNYRWITCDKTPNTETQYPFNSSLARYTITSRTRDAY